MKDNERQLHKDTLPEEAETPAEKKQSIADNGETGSPAEVSKTEEKIEEKDTSFNKKKKIRLLVSAIAAIITMTFFGLSYTFFSVMTMSIVFVACVGVIALAVVSLFRDWDTPYKLSITALYIGAVFLVVYFALNKSGLLSSIDSADDVVNYINNSGGVAEVIFVLANFLQVTIIPIPSTITTTAGALLFEGIWKPLYLTVIGLVIGSMFAFFLGRVLGVRFANWLVGEKTIAKYKAWTKGRDKIVLFYMFIFPFFPDDFLCILAGMTNYTYIGFFFLQVFSRTLGTLTTILIAKGIVSIPFYGWWLALWAVIIILVIVLLIYTIKYSEKIEQFVMKIIDKLTFGLTSKKRLEKESAEAAKSADAAAEQSKENGAETPPDGQGEVK